MDTAGYPTDDEWQRMRPARAQPYNTFPLGVKGYDDDFAWSDDWQPGNGTYGEDD